MCIFIRPSFLTFFLYNATITSRFLGRKPAMLKTISKVAIIVILAGLLIFIIAGGLNPLLGIKTSTPSEPTTGSVPVGSSLLVNEVMTKNQATMALEDGTTPDWIELYNGTGATINLSGYGLSDNPSDPFKFKFSEMTIGNGSYLVVLAMDKTDNNTSGLLQTGFGLSSSGETIILTAPDGTVLSSVTTGNMVSDISYGLTSNGTYEYFANPTPGEANSGPTSTTPEFSRKISNAQVIINEYIVDNQSSLIDSFGERHPWAELKNISDTEIDISGYGLTDNGKVLGKWTFPEGTKISAGGLLVVCLSGRDTVVNNTEIHAGFRLGSKDTQLVLTDAKGATLDSVAIDRAMGTASSGRTVDDSSLWRFFPEPTPGKENTTKYFDRLDVSEGKILPN